MNFRELVEVSANLGILALLVAITVWLGPAAFQHLLDRWRDRSGEAARRETETRLQQLRALDERAMVVHQARFEKEFRSYEELWSAVVEFRDATQALRPTVGYGDPFDAEEKKRRLERWSGAYKAIYKSVENDRPFYAEGVHAVSWALIKVATREWVEYKNARRPGDDAFWDRADKHAAEIGDLAEKLCVAIRERLHPSDVRVPSVLGEAEVRGEASQARTPPAREGQDRRRGGRWEPSKMRCLSFGTSPRSRRSSRTWT